jgi:purine-cytosine permease-like protein
MIISNILIKLVIPFIILYIISYFFYRYLLHPNYKWHQKGNACYEDAKYFSILVATAIYLIGCGLYTGVIIW